MLAEKTSITQEIELGCCLTYIELRGHKPMTSQKHHTSKLDKRNSKEKHTNIISIRSTIRMEPRKNNIFF